MGAYGSPEHLPGNNQEPQYQYQYGYRQYRNPTAPIRGPIKKWQIFLLVVWGIFVGLFSLGMFTSINTYSGNKAYAIITALAFLALGITFIVTASARKRSWPYILATFITFFAFFGGMGENQPTQAAAVAPPSTITQSSASISSKPVSSSPAKASSKPNSAPSKAPTDAATQYKEQCAAYKYKTIARNPNDYKGKQAKFTGKVVQIEEVWGSSVLRVNVTKDEYGAWDDTIYVEYTPKSEGESRILENDVITMYGKLDGIKSYTTVLGSEVSIPYLKAQYIDISSESK